MMRKIAIPILWFCLIVCTGQRVSVAAELDTLLSSYEAHGFSGVVLVAVDGEVVFEKGYGFSDRARKVANTPDTWYDFGSIAKTFTGAAVLSLEAEGRLATTDPLERYIGTLPAAKSAATVHQLAAHRAGLAHGSRSRIDGSDRPSFVRSMRDAPIDSPPGEQYRYSNEGFSLLAVVVEVAAEEPFAAYVRRRLIAPVGLEETMFLPDVDPEDERFPKGYSDSSDRPAPPLSLP